MILFIFCAMGAITSLACFVWSINFGFDLTRDDSSDEMEIRALARRLVIAALVMTIVFLSGAVYFFNHLNG